MKTLTVSLDGKQYNPDFLLAVALQAKVQTLRMLDVELTLRLAQVSQKFQRLDQEMEQYQARWSQLGTLENFSQFLDEAAEMLSTQRLLRQELEEIKSKRDRLNAELSAIELLIPNNVSR